MLLNLILAAFIASIGVFWHLRSVFADSGIATREELLIRLAREWPLAS
jgi:hypothetical protein